MTNENLLVDQMTELRMAVKESIEGLKTSTEKGFERLLDELRLSREQGHIPIHVFKEVLESQNKAHGEVNKTLVKIVGAILTWATTVVGAGVYLTRDEKPPPPQSAIVRELKDIAPVDEAPTEKKKDAETR